MLVEMEKLMQYTKQLMLENLPVKVCEIEEVMLGNILVDQEMSQFNVLARCAKNPTFLVSKIGPNYINVLELRQITGQDTTTEIAKLNLREIFVYQRTGLIFKKNQKTRSVYDEILRWRNQYHCTQEFKINSKGNIAIASVLPSGFIVSVIILAQFYDLNRSQPQKLSQDLSEPDKDINEPVYEYRAISIKVKEGQDQETASVVPNQSQTGQQDE